MMDIGAFPQQLFVSPLAQAIGNKAYPAVQDDPFKAWDVDKKLSL